MASKIKRLNRESDPPPGVLASPVPQYYDQETEEVEDVEGRKGAPLSMLVDTDGTPINPATAGGQTTTHMKLDSLEGLIGALDVTKETNPDAASATLLALIRGLMSAAAKETTLEAIKSTDGIKKIADAVTVSGLENLATAAKQDTIKGVLDTLATESTLASILAKLADPATQTTLAALKGLFDSGDAKVTLTGHAMALQGAIVTGAKTVTSTAAELFAGSSRLSGRHAMVITNTGNNTVYIGASNVSASNGFPVFPQDTIRIEFDPQSSVAVFAVSDGPNVEIRVVELA